uniref:Reverse transcriptase zinc-binding domain-containing protein n=1 Tax=Tanacetum cinerariifolium TaxID=118510 RepID=A0A6L2NT71_TANCI|nr:hypothetical protein [Tanacetum cinerariifolium]
MDKGDKEVTKQDLVAKVVMEVLGRLPSDMVLIRGFLWCNGEYKRGKAKVAWDDICLPKEEGGLGLRSLDVFNIALVTTYIWNIVSNKESLWLRWIHTYKLRCRSFGDIPFKDGMSWGWLKLLQLWDIVRPFFWVKLGNGTNTSIWFDNWCSLSPLNRFLTPRDISREGFSISTSVAELVLNGSWSWPQSWLLKASDLGLIPHPAWEALRPRGNQDKMRQWDVGVGTDLNLLRCALCDSQPDSHAHLFFECPFSSKVWLYVRELVGMELIPPFMHDIISYLQPISKKRTALSILGKLILAASSYFIWLERNNGVIKQVKKSPEDIRDIFMVTVHLKLLTFRFKDTSMVNQLLARWKMPKLFRLYG